MQIDDITSEFLVEAIGRDDPKIIEKYKYSCLLLEWGLPNEPLHVVIALGTINQEYDTPVVVTVYRPDRDPERRWENDYAKRQK